MGRPAIDLTKRIFGRLTVIQRSGSNKHGNALWECLCKCGNITIVRGDCLVKGVTKSCGCLHRECMPPINIIHGHAKNHKKTKEYHAWCRIQDRCNNPKDKSYSDYGGRGIKCLYKSFEEFLADVRSSPGPEYSIERMGNNGHYEPGNCKWATIQEQSRNKRSNKYVTCYGTTKIIADWATFLDVPKETLYARINRYGWLPEKAIMTPINTKYRRKDDDIQ